MRNASISIAVLVASAGVTGSAMAAFDFQVTEVWPGQVGPDLTKSWFELTNHGDTAWDRVADGDLHFDDLGPFPQNASTVSGLDTIAPGESVIILTKASAADIDTFVQVWGDTGQVGNAPAGGGLALAGDTVTLWVGDRFTSEPIQQAYPGVSSGSSWDIMLGEISIIGNLSGAYATDMMAGESGAEFAVGSPGSVMPTPGAIATIIFAGGVVVGRRRR